MNDQEEIYLPLQNTPQRNAELLEAVRKENQEARLGRIKKKQCKLRTYEPWVFEALQKHIDEGWSISSFVGKYNVDYFHFYSWLNEIPEMNKLRQEYNLKKWRESRFMAFINEE